MEAHLISDKKFIKWMMVSAVVGIAIGIVIGILISGGNDKTGSGDSFEQTSEVATSLGWSVLDNYINTTEAVIKVQKYQTLGDSLSESLGEKYSNILPHKKPAVISSSISTKPKPEKEKIKEKPEIIPDNKSNNTYLDGWGNVEIHSATLEQIDQIPYVSVTAAEAIFNHLKENHVTNFDQLLELKGVGEKTVERMRENFHIK